IHKIADLSLDTTTIVNQAPAFICYMTLDNRQLPKDTNVLFLRNGNLIRSAGGEPVIESFRGQQMFRLDDPSYPYRVPLSGLLPPLPLGFTTYPTSASIENAPEITLHRYANESVHGPLAQFVVSSVETDSGFDVQQRCYRYEGVSAAQDATLS